MDARHEVSAAVRDAHREALAHDAWEALASWLRAAQASMSEQVREYPTPIARCDQHLAKLLEQRGRVQERLARMAACAARGGGPSAEAVREVLGTDPATDESAEAMLRSRLRAALFAVPCLD
jgi:hypothetical protein